MKLLGYLFFLLFVFAGVINFAQNGINQASYSGTNENHLTIKYVSIYTCYNRQTQTSYSNNSSYHTGKSVYDTWDSANNCYNSNNTEYRTAFRFSIPVPNNGILTSATIQATGHSGEIVYLPVDLYSYSYPDVFSEIGNSGSIFNYNDTQQWNDITSYVSQHLINGYFCVGARSQGYFGYVSVKCLFEWIIPAHLSFENNMGGQLSVNGSNYTGSYSNDYWLGTNISLSVNEPQSASGYTWVWNDSEAPSNKSEWKKIKGDEQWKSFDQSYSFSVAADDHNSTYKAIMKKLCNLTFNAGSGTVYLNYNSYSSPKAIELVEQNTVYAFATDHTANGLDYTFLYWDNCPGSNTITASAHTAYTAFYSVRPSVANRNQQITSSIGQYITIQWNANPNPSVYEYRVYRKIGHTGTPSLIATTSNTTFTDPDYIMTGSSEDTYLMYDVRPVYSVNQTESDPYFQSAAFGRIEYLITDEKNIASFISNLPEEYFISNYPNPFNPMTTINYQLPENGFVTIKVFDILGKEIETLVNENKSAGYYKVNFDGSNLTSGVYIYTIRVNGITESKKMLLAK